MKQIASYNRQPIYDNLEVISYDPTTGIVQAKNGEGTISIPANELHVIVGWDAANSYRNRNLPDGGKALSESIDNAIKSETNKYWSDITAKSEAAGYGSDIDSYRRAKGEIGDVSAIGGEVYQDGVLVKGGRDILNEIPDNAVAGYNPSVSMSKQQTFEAGSNVEDNRIADSKNMSSKKWIEKYGGTFQDWKKAKATPSVEEQQAQNFTSGYNQARAEAEKQGRTLSVAEYRQGLENTGNTGNIGSTGNTTQKVNPPTDFTSIVDELANVIKDLIPKDRDINTLSDQELADVMREAEANVGPEFTRLRERTEQDFNLAIKTEQENLQKLFKQTGEDVRETKVRQARNYQEAMADTQMALQNRQLTFSGIRKKEEGKVEQSNRDILADIQKATNRTLESGMKAFEKLYGSSALPKTEGVEGFQPTMGNEIGTEQIKQNRSLEDLMFRRNDEIDKEFQTLKGERSLSNIL